MNNTGRNWLSKCIAEAMDQFATSNITGNEYHAFVKACDEIKYDYDKAVVIPKAQSDDMAKIKTIT